MEMAMQLVSRDQASEILYLNFLYWLAIMCVAFKLTWIIRQVSDFPPLRRWPIVISAAALCFVLFVKAFSRFEGGDDAQFLDIARELALCCFLLTAIRMIRDQTNRY